MTAAVEVTREHLLCVFLTPREVEVLQWLVDGMTVAQIAQEWAISHRTVDTHLRNIHRKLGSKNPLQAVLVALRAGVVQL